MATERLSMRKTREILRQKWELHRSNREVAISVCSSPSTIAGTVGRARAAGIDWVAAQALSDDELEARMYRSAPSPIGQTRSMPDCAYLHAERRRVGVTLELLHHEYLEQQPDGYRYTQFCEIYRRWAKKRGLSMRQEHIAGEKLFVDYSGKKPHYIDAQTGARVEVEFFVAVLGASNYTFAEATASQQGRDFIASHVRAFEYLGGVPVAVVPDQLKSGVTTACWYEPKIQHTYEEMAEHYGTTVLPARPRRPRDKAKVEGGVLIAQRWILACLRNQRFFSLEALNERIAELLELLNARRMKIYQKSRRELFDALDAPELKPLPATRFVYGDWKHAKVNIDYHIEVEGHYYSCHHSLIGESVEARMTATTVEIFLGAKRHTSHARSYLRGRFTTKPEHRPKAHEDKWPPSRIIEWAASKVGPKTAALVETLLMECRHAERGYRSCMGIMRLDKRYGHERLEAACARSLAVRGRSYRHVESILKNGLDHLPLQLEMETTETRPPVLHENLRGRTYYN